MDIGKIENWSFGAHTGMVSDALCVASAAAVAVTVQLTADEKLGDAVVLEEHAAPFDGAVTALAAESVLEEESAHPPDTVQLTAVFVEPVTFAYTLRDEPGIAERSEG